MDADTRLMILRKACMCRAFEQETFKWVKEKKIKIPVYLSAGQEYTPATLSSILPWKKPAIFAQHRAHSTYLCFGGDMDVLIAELLGVVGSYTGLMGGSASIHSPDINMFGHDGLMGSQVPIAVGHCYATKKPTIVFMGDAAAEEDYVLGAMGWAATKKLPMLFVVEDNDLSILTKTEVRRSWKMINVARAFGMFAFENEDDPYIIAQAIHQATFPGLLNLKTHRLYWHSGAGIDDPDTFDRLKKDLQAGSNKDIYWQEEKKVQEAWQKQLKKL